ncbi:MAG: 50S ribosomal protein L18 [Bdellovibrionota bacterium]
MDENSPEVAYVVHRLKITADRPRLSVFRSNKHIYAQIIDDVNQKLWPARRPFPKAQKASFAKTSDLTAATEVGKLIGQAAKKAKIKK